MPRYRHLDIDEPAAGVLRCVMSNPPRHTMVAAELNELAAFVKGLEQRDGVRAVVFTGGGEGVFIAHYEVAELAESAAGRATRRAPQDADGLHAFHRLTLAMQAAPYVTIAAVNGNAGGGGCEFALGCDFRLMADGDFRIGLPETGVGIIPGAGGTQRFARLLGVAKALDLILHGTALTPREAHALGVVHRLLPPAELAAEALTFASNLASRSPIGLAAAKRAIYAGQDVPLAAGLAIEQREFERCMASEDAARALRATLAGERIHWQGR